MKVVVFGCGLVGQAMVRDLADRGDLTITVADRDQRALAALDELPGVSTVVADVLEPGVVTGLAASHDLVVGAVPGYMGFSVVKAAVEAGTAVVDISFMPEDPFELNELAQARGVPVLIDCGVAPGISNFLVGRAAADLDEVDRVNIMVGGLPVVRHLPYEYGAVFSPVDVLEEYTRPAIIVEHGCEVTAEALSELEVIEVPGVGTLEAFLTDGLRSMRRTLDIPFMKEKTLRYPGHCERIRLLVQTGLLSTVPIEVGDVEVAPRDVTAELLRRAWKLGPNEEDLTVLHIDVNGWIHGQQCTTTFDLVDVYDEETNVTSMARTTGYACTAVVDLVVAGLIADKGVIAPEQLGADPSLADRFLSYLESRGIRIAHATQVGEQSEA